MSTSRQPPHDPSACGLCRANHPLMRYDCAAQSLDLAEITLRMKEAGTAHLVRFKQGRRVNLSRAQVLEHLRIGLSTGACSGGCVKVFEVQS